MTNAKDYLGKEVKVIIDRSIGSKHSKYDFIYPVNYGYVPGTMSPDGEELDAYVLGEEKPLKTFKGICVAIIHRTNDDDDKLVVVPSTPSAPLGVIDLSDEEIEKQIEFQEKWFKHEIVSRFR